MKIAITWAPWATAVITVLLAGITWWYAFLTSRILDATRQAQKDAVRPQVFFKIETHVGVRDLLLPYLVNLGIGPATNIHISITYLADEAEENSTWRSPIMTSGEERRLIPVGFDENGNRDLNFFKRVNHVVLRGSCNDLYGNEIDIVQDLNVEEWISSYVVSGQIDNPKNQELARPLQDISDYLSMISGAIDDYTGYSKKLEHEIHGSSDEDLNND